MTIMRLFYGKLHIFQEDLYYPHPLVQDMVWGFLHNVAEPILSRWPFSKLRGKALKVAMEHVHYEDKSSRYLCIGCIEKVAFYVIKLYDVLPLSQIKSLTLTRVFLKRLLMST